MKKIIFGGLFSFLPVPFLAQLFITEVYRDTPYSEYIDINRPEYANPTPATVDYLRKRHRGEFVEIYNASDTDLNLKDWTLIDDEGSTILPDRIIKSGQFMVVVANNNDGGDYFPTFFPVTQGKENQIIYQNTIKLSNDRETISLVALNIAGSENTPSYTTSSVSFEKLNSYGLSAGSGPEVMSNLAVMFMVADWQYGYTGELQIPNPLDATIKPPIKPLDDYIGTMLSDNYSLITWDRDVDNLVNQICNISIGTVSQNQNPIFTLGGKSFLYDEAGNSSAANNYNPGIYPTQSNGFSADELEEIKNAIKLAPNPTYNIVNVSITGIAQGKISSVQVFSSTGALLFTKNNLQDSSNFYFNFDLSGQITGVYVANFTLTSGQVVGKNVLKY